MPRAGPVIATTPVTPLSPLSAPPPAPLAWGATSVPVSATLAANEIIDRRRRHGQPVLPLAFGEAGLPVHPLLRQELAAAAGRGGYGPVAGIPALREAAASYWARRGLPTSPDQVVAGPGSKPLLFALLMAIGTDVAVPCPSWVSYAAQARLIGVAPRFVPAVAGQGGICDPDALDRAVTSAAAAGRPIRSVIATIPDNPTGRLASPDAVRALAAVAERHDLIIISDEIYRDLVHEDAGPFLSPAQVAPERTVVTTALSKSLALGGWRIGAARLPSGPLGAAITERLRGVGSEIWSAPGGSGPAGRGGGLPRTPGDSETNRAEPVTARHGGPGRGQAVRRRRAGRARAPGGVLPVSGLRRVARPAGPAGPAHRPGPGRPPGRALRRRVAAGQRVRRAPGRPAAAAGHRAAVRGHRRPARGRARSAGPAGPAADRRRAGRDRGRCWPT